MSENETYTVLARKYRPATFADLIGQEALVRTLTNAINQDRLAHAYLLTGIRGVGKTSTARIIAKALNCVGSDGNGNATPEPCGECEHCKAISESRHVDVLEMDAASRTGVGDIREIIENANYLPTSARYKIYIIDEVHMLSKSAFNALLKTLEEPPAHVKFIFATTEVRKIPITILSRCQRFDLPRVDTELLVGHLKDIAAKEGAKVEEVALALVANAAEGSVRDALSLLDQAIAHGGESKEVGEAQVQQMLGLVGRENIFTLFESLAGGDIKTALEQLRELYKAGGEPLVILQDLLELSHFITQLKIIPDLKQAGYIAEHDRTKGAELAEKLSVPFLSRCWQMLLKGVGEVQTAPNPLVAAEMVLIRLGYASTMPLPGDLIKQLKGSKGPEKASAVNGKVETAPVAPQPEPVPVSISNPNNFKELVNLFKVKDEPFLYNWLQNDVHLIKFEQGKLEIRLSGSAPKDLPNRIGSLLTEWVGQRWIVIVSNAEGSKTINEEKQENLQANKDEALQDERVQAVLDLFPGAEIVGIEPIEGEVKEEEREKIEAKK